MRSSLVRSMSDFLKVSDLKKDDQIEFKPTEGPDGRHTVIVAWGVQGVNGPISPWMVVLKSTWKNGTMSEVQEGEEVRSGLGIMDVIDSSAMRVRAKVNQADVSALRVGQPVRITLDSFPSKVFTGHLDQLSQIGAISQMSNRVRSFLAVFSVDGSDPHLMPDLAAAIDVDAAGDRR